ncbi:MAG: OB-fold domain-containing protein [Christensenellales bacterium]
MIDFIEGTVESKAPGELVICAGGVGFRCCCSNATLAEAPAKGEKWRCYSRAERARGRDGAVRFRLPAGARHV